MEENNEFEIQQVLEPGAPVDDAPLPEEKPAALTLVIQSWATPIIGIIMLIVGLFGGFYIRPLLSTEPTPVAVEGSASSDNENAPVTIPTADTERAAQQLELMTAVVERTRHFRGDPDAPVTIIEFSDFQ